MARLVGSRGQVVIEKEIRERLGVRPGWQALQVLDGDHVKIYFVPPEHDRSLRGAAKPFIQASSGVAEDWDEAIADGFAADFGARSDAD